MKRPRKIGAMDPGEFLARTAALGLLRDDLADIFVVDSKTALNWHRADAPIPPGIVKELADLEDETRRREDALIAEWEEAGGRPVVKVWRVNEAMWEERPDLDPFPARWWQALVWRAVQRSSVEPQVTLWPGVYGQDGRRLDVEPPRG